MKMEKLILETLEKHIEELSHENPVGIDIDSIDQLKYELTNLFSIHNVSQQRELFFAVLKWAKQADLDYPDEMLIKDFEQFNVKNCP